MPGGPVAGAVAMVASVLGHGGTASVWVAVAVTVAALAPAGARWLRVAQREHYLADASSRFAIRWWTSEPLNVGLAAIAVAGVVLSGLWPLCALATAAVAVVGPLHLSLRGRTSPLVWTRRLKVLAAVWLALQAAVVGIGAAVGAPAPFAAAGLVAVPALVDVAMLVTAPVERRLSEQFVRAAAERLRRVSPTVVAITGSYGKTSTKNHVAHLVTGSRSVVATPASFNNRGGLARSVNEHLAEGTEVFVAEMGTYGAGEIRELCSWCPPQVAVVTAIGPVHLERFGSEDAILAAKREITEHASVVIVNADDGRLTNLADALALPEEGPTVVRCSSEDETADVCLRRKDGTATLVVDGRRVAEEVPLQPGIQPGNLACAVAVALRLGVPTDAVVARIPTLPPVANRLTAGTAPSGVYVVDDTFNSNPAGARAALALLAAAPGEGRRVLVTPGMVELGRRQPEENRAFAEAACDVATEVVVVGLTNRRSLLAGVGDRRPVVVVRTRQEAVAWVRANLGSGDAVLYENDLPDQYP
jgi:UDP-N-acetylmuramoyl-tripeptide--D-alanyl-D-alanine ligase